MPLRCTKCGKLTNDESNDECKVEGTICDFEKVATIHLLHPDGKGRIVSKGRRVVTGEKPGDEKTETVDMHLCCQTSTQRPQMTDVRYAATCLACLESIPAPAEENEDDQAPHEPILSPSPFPTEAPEALNANPDRTTPNA